LYNIKNHINDYEKDKITNFINEHLEKIKEANKDIEQNIPQNIKFNATQTVEFIAKHDAMKILIDRIYLIEQNDSMEIYSKKISKEGYTAPIINMKNYSIGEIEPEDDENEETSKITTKQQVLILKYMMDFLKVSMVDNSVKAKFIKNLTGKSYDNIYKAIREPTKYSSVRRFKLDMRFVKIEFEKLGLQNIVNEIIKDADKNQ
jgi:hypothetical protein